jgi:hypothetical protein
MQATYANNYTLAKKQREEKALSKCQAPIEIQTNEDTDMKTCQKKWSQIQRFPGIQLSHRKITDK